jgi:predicted porin
MTASSPRNAVSLALLTAGLMASGGAKAVDFGPHFTILGFAKAETNVVSAKCDNCDVNPYGGRQFQWADELVQGKSYGSGTTNTTLVQPHFIARTELTKGFKLEGEISQRYRNGSEDFSGFWYDRNVALSHPDYGTLRYGAMAAKGWVMPDTVEYANGVGIGAAWSDSGAGYGLLTRAIRFTTRPLDVADGDLVLEATYDPGKAGWKKNKPFFFELYGQFHKGDLVIDAIYQTTRNGGPSAFTHGPFAGLTPWTADDASLGGSSQSIALLMARYQVDPGLEVLGGLRGNRWSGAYAVYLSSTSPNYNGFENWNRPFNVDWSKDLGGGVYKGYPATSLDLLLGARYRRGNWTYYTGFTHLGAAATDNPSNRGQSNALSFNTVGADYNFRNGLRAYATAGLVQYARKGLAPLSMPSNSAFTNIDSRVKSRGTSLTVGANYDF